MTVQCVCYIGQIGSEWMLVGVANNSQRGTSERVREKMLLKSGSDTQGLIELATIHNTTCSCPIVCDCLCQLMWLGHMHTHY